MSLRVALCLICLVFLPATGCAPRDPISSYVVPHPPAKGTVWTFRLIGSKKAVQEQAPLFKTFVESIRFDSNDGYPVWKLPEGWTETKSPEGLAVLKLPTTSPLMVTVLPENAFVPLRTPQLLEIFNTQRNVVSLPKVGPATTSLDDNFPLGTENTSGDTSTGPSKVTIETPSETDDTKRDAWLAEARKGGELSDWKLADQQGKRIELSGESAQFGDTLLIAAVVPVPYERSSLPMSIKAPPHWKEAAQTQFSIYSKRVTDSQGRSASITISPAMGDMLANVNRWRNQAGLELLNEENYLEHIKVLEINGSPGAYTEAIGATRGIIGGLVIRSLDVAESENPEVYFFKLDGAPEVVIKEREAFKEFLNSVKFR